jgi:D-tyrosyl-tRNA(Tyr) deacylase
MRLSSEENSLSPETLEVTASEASSETVKRTLTVQPPGDAPSRAPPFQSET